MEKERRVGTFTLGLILIVLGVVTLLSMIFHFQIFKYVLMFWPVILISLGVEILVSTIGVKKFKYDILGMVLICVILCCTAVMSGTSYFINNILARKGLEDAFLDQLESTIKYRDESYEHVENNELPTEVVINE